MTARVFADTNIPIYALDIDSNKREKAFSLMRENPVISVQVVNEFINTAISKMRISRSEVNQLAGVMMRNCKVVSMDSRVIRKAIALGEKFQFSHWDTLIVAAALKANCNILYTEDMQHGQIIDKRLDYKTMPPTLRSWIATLVPAIVHNLLRIGS